METYITCKKGRHSASGSLQTSWGWIDLCLREWNQSGTDISVCVIRQISQHKGFAMKKTVLLSLKENQEFMWKFLTLNGVYLQSCLKCVTERYEGNVSLLPDCCTSNKNCVHPQSTGPRVKLLFRDKWAPDMCCLLLLLFSRTSLEEKNQQLNKENDFPCGVGWTQTKTFKNRDSRKLISSGQSNFNSLPKVIHLLILWWKFFGSCCGASYWSVPITDVVLNIPGNPRYQRENSAPFNFPHRSFAMLFSYFSTRTHFEFISVDVMSHPQAFRVVKRGGKWKSRKLFVIFWSACLPRRFSDGLPSRRASG